MLEAHFRIALDPGLLAQLPDSASVTVSNAMPGLLKGWKGQWSA